MIDGEDNGTGGAADLLGVDTTTGGIDQSGGADDKGGGGDDKGGADPDFYGNLSAEAVDAENHSNRDYVKAKGFKDLDGIVKSLRAAEKAIHDRGGIKVPGENATDEEKTAFARAIGVPEKPDGYEMPVIENGRFDPNKAEGPDNLKTIPLNVPLITKLAESAHKNGTPKGAFEGLVRDYVALQMDEAAAAEAQEKTDAQAWVKKQGAQAAARLAFIDKAAAGLGLTRDHMLKLRSAWGPDFALETMAKLGEGMAEDSLITGGRGRFGVTPAEAQAEMNKLNSDPEHMAAVNRKDPAVLARRKRLNDAIAAGRDAAKAQ